ncbi:MAG: D-alanine--D-alanine ligase [Alphaproteobacteria bacterium MarineAlpha5_Bin8]|nr:MAG: D-alanine--D-alanine ligase [Alphaproteobacteria bacterium MarineAlpha5_Bin7]PPR48240.1 MAG: D-alanine--D-alanine ligase [Alphaproteobacteria bacterium MarineAlpha5_Bin8]PPR54456.1 MAG: D-alanine--D-alanine ligase [Alphaproteobacteria bacterium MarineAlpha5_Bin6]|tara:strand:- start:6052 stop:6993 length:942 start_codon:yes stop_codon:yes gene_type:complete
MQKKIIILEGGFNEEHEVSLNTSKKVKDSLKNLNYTFEIFSVSPSDFINQIKNFDKNCIFFNALHGTYGEDGSIQKILEKNNFYYTHSDSKTSKIAFDKSLTKKNVKKIDIPILESSFFSKNKITPEVLYETYNKYGAFVMKPVSSGSSFGIKIFKSKQDVEDFKNNIEFEIKMYDNHNEIMLEKYIKGRELTVGVWQNKNVSDSLAVTEIIYENDFYDYKAKYVKGLSRHILPAKIPKKIYDQCCYYAKIIHDHLGCKGISRSDFIYDENNIYFLEINSQPGLTMTSLLPEQLQFKSIHFDDLIENLIKASL